MSCNTGVAHGSLGLKQMTCIAIISPNLKQNIGGYVGYTLA